MSALELKLLSVNVARPHRLGEQAGEPVISAIAKKPISGASVVVRPTNIAGDSQANLEKHGGPDKAIYAYPADHWPWWEKEHHFHCAPGLFGENLTVQGADETQVNIGDRFGWGEVQLEITQPRIPCIKFQIYTAREDMGALMLSSGRCGWYFRVLQAGTAPVNDARLVRVARGAGPTVREAYFAVFDRRVPESRRREIASVPALSAQWRKRLLPNEA